MKKIAIYACAVVGLALFAAWFVLSRTTHSGSRHLKSMTACLKEGNDTLNAGSFNKAIELLEDGLVQAKAQGNVEYETAFEVSLGSAYSSAYKYDQALTHGLRALELSKVRGDEYNQAGALNVVAACYSRSGEHEKAIEYFQEAVSLLKRRGQKQPAALLTYNMGEEYRLMGQYQESLKCMEETLKVTEDLNDQAAGGRTKCAIGLIYNELGQFERALFCYNEALKMGEYQRDDALQAEALTGLGKTYAMLNKQDLSISCLEKALAASERTGDIRLQANALSGLGIAQAIGGDYRSAAAKFEKALSLNDPLQDAASQIACLSNLSISYRELGELQKALECLNRAEKLMQKIGDGLEKSQVLNNRGIVLLALGKMAAAKADLAKSAGMFDNIRGEMGNSEERSALFLTLPYVHVMLAASELELGNQQAAFEAVERSRSKSLIDLLATRRFSGTKRFEKSEEVVRLEEKLTNLGRTADPSVIAAVDRQRLILIQEIREKDPLLSSLTTVQTPKFADIASVLDPDVALVEFFHPVEYQAGGAVKDELWIFVVGNGKLSFARSPIKRQDLNQALQDFLEAAADPESSVGEFRKASQKVYDSMFAPVAAEIAAARTLVIVPWGEAFHIPYSAVWHASGKGGSYLGEERKLVVAPSGYSLPYLLKQRSNKHSSIYAVGNPLTGYDPLPGAEREAQEVALLFPQREVRLGAEATETRIKNALGRPDVIHFATHGYFNPEAPALSGILLAPDKVNDGSLEVHELFQQDWSGVSLVTLSACSSGRTELHPGDDIVGLIQGCFFAGTPSVLASLWNVEDEATRRLMVAFYQALAAGRSKPEALQMAQASVRKDPQFSHPVFWSAFELFGDWQ